jgi:hypothetical protein
MIIVKRHGGGLLCPVVVAVLLLLLGCGRKGPPVPRAATIPPPVRDLTAEVLEKEVHLAWSIPKKGETGFPGIAGFQVYRHAVHRSEPPCPGCPLSFQEILKIGLSDPASARIHDGRVGCTTRFDPAVRYAFKVVVVHKSGGVSDDSNIATVP